MITPPAPNSPSLRALLDALYRFKENPQPHFPDPQMIHPQLRHLLQSDTQTILFELEDRVPRFSLVYLTAPAFSILIRYCFKYLPRSEFQPLLAEFDFPADFDGQECSPRDLIRYHQHPEKFNDFDWDAVRTSPTINQVTDFNKMHLTLPKRHADGNPYIFEHLQDQNNTAFRALFLGGSLGHTAIDLMQEAREAYQQHWHADVVDLYSPAEIMARYPQLPPLPDHSSFPLNFHKGDMREHHYADQHYDLIDISNSLGYLNRIQDRVALIAQAMEKLKPDGILRLTTPSYESILEQVIFCKRHHETFEPIFMSLFGKTIMPMANDEIASHVRLTQQTQQIFEVMRAPQHRDFFITHLGDFERSFYHDLNQLHPITYGMGFLEASAVEMEKKVRVEADYNREKIGLISSLLKAYNSLVDHAEVN